MKCLNIFGLVIGIIDLVRYVRYLVVGITSLPHIDRSNYASDSSSRKINYDEVKPSPDHIFLLESCGFDGYLAVLCFMTLFAASLVIGIVTKRTALIWPWLFATFHGMANLGYVVIQLILNDSSAISMVKPSIGYMGYIYAFGISVILWSIVFVMLKRMYVDNIVRNNKKLGCY